MHSLSPCQCCRHRDGHTCAAFPDGIPSDLLRGERTHFGPIDGDHGVQYELGPEPESKMLAETLASVFGDEVLRPSAASPSAS